jgi:hypothetical protein
MLRIFLAAFCRQLLPRVRRNGTSQALWIKVMASALNRVSVRPAILRVVGDVVGGLGRVHAGEGVAHGDPLVSTALSRPSNLRNDLTQHLWHMHRLKRSSSENYHSSNENPPAHSGTHQAGAPAEHWRAH